GVETAATVDRDRAGEVVQVGNDGVTDVEGILTGVAVERHGGGGGGGEDLDGVVAGLGVKGQALRVAVGQAAEEGAPEGRGGNGVCVAEIVDDVAEHDGVGAAAAVDRHRAGEAVHVALADVDGVV